MSEIDFPPESIDDGSGREIPVRLARCECSNIDADIDEDVRTEVFMVFWDIRFNPAHLHIQCYDCQQTYCPYKQCVPPPTAEVIQ